MEVNELEGLYKYCIKIKTFPNRTSQSVTGRNLTIGENNYFEFRSLSSSKSFFEKGFRIIAGDSL